MNDKITFQFTDTHRKLLARMFVGWEDCEFGAPAIDCKRPYGNSDVYGDIGEILELVPAINPGTDDAEWSAEQEAEMRQLHEQTQIALQIFLQNALMATGVYSADRYLRDWSWAANTL